MHPSSELTPPSPTAKVNQQNSQKLEFVSRIPGLSPSHSIRSPEDTGLSPRTPQNSQEVPRQLQCSEIQPQSAQAKAFDKQDYSLQSMLLESFSRSSPETLDCSPSCSGGLLRQFAQPNWSTDHPQVASSTQQSQFGQEIVDPASPRRKRPPLGEKQYCGKPKDPLICPYCNWELSRRCEFKYKLLFDLQIEMLI